MFNILLKMFSKGFLHWFTQRTSACLLLTSVICVSISNSLFLGFIGLILVLIHFEAGVHTIISDYMHEPKSKLVSDVSVDLLIIYLTKTLFLLLICI